MSNRSCSVFIFGCFLVGCQARLVDNYEVKIDPNFSPEQIQTIYGALNTWEKVSNDQVSFETAIESPSKTRHSISFEFASSNEQLDAICNGERGVAGCNNRNVANDRSDIYLLNSILIKEDEATVLQLIEHEIGHALDLHHTGIGTVMCATSICAAMQVQCADVQQYELVRGQFEEACD